MEKRNTGFSNDKIVNIFSGIIIVVFLLLGGFIANNRGLDSFRTSESVATMQGITVKNYSQIATENFARWNDALRSRGPQKVAELYSSEATFLPTLSPKFMNGNDETEEYFKNFLKKNPVGKIVLEKVQILSSVSYLHSGLYNFQIDEAGDRHIVEARFTFLWTLNEKGIWKIAHHHSSVRPKG